MVIVGVSQYFALEGEMTKTYILGILLCVVNNPHKNGASAPLPMPQVHSYEYIRNIIYFKFANNSFKRVLGFSSMNPHLT